MDATAGSERSDLNHLVVRPTEEVPESSPEMITAYANPRDGELDEISDSASSGADEGDFDEGDLDESSSLFSSTDGGDFFDSCSQSSESSADSFPSGNFEQVPAGMISKTISGRWVDLETLTEHPSAFVGGYEAAFSDFANFCSLLASTSCDISGSAEKKLPNDNRYVRLDEPVISKIFALLVCSKVAGGLYAYETPELQYFLKQWASSVRDLVENLQRKPKAFFKDKRGSIWVKRNSQ